MKKTKKQLVESALRKNTDGLTIAELSRELKLARNTVVVALAELKGAGQVRVREVGVAKLHYLR